MKTRVVIFLAIVGLLVFFTAPVFADDNVKCEAKQTQEQEVRIPLLILKITVVTPNEKSNVRKLVEIRVIPDRTDVFEAGGKVGGKP